MWNLLLTLAFSLSLVHVECFTRQGEETLRTRLTTGYNPDVRPEPVTKVFMQFHITAIADVDIKEEVFSVSGWWSMKWNDDRLNWTDYAQINVVQFHEMKIWTPAIVVSNSINDLSAIKESTIPIRVDRHGTVNWNPPGLIKVACPMDVSYFPFDKQTCHIEITSFGYTIQEMDVKLADGDGISFRHYSQSGEWDVVTTRTQRSEYSDDGYTYARIIYYMTIERKPLYYGLNMLLPVIVCSALTLFVFLLPPESGEKISYCLTVLLAFMVILTLVADDLPTTASSTSILAIYIAVVLILGGLSVVISIYILHIFFLPEEKPIGPRTEMLTRFFISIFCLQGCCNSQRQKVEPGGSFKKKNEANENVFKTPSTPLMDPLTLSLWDETPPSGGKGDKYLEYMQMRSRPGSRVTMTENARGALNERPKMIKEQSGIGSFRPRTPPALDDKKEEDVEMTWQIVSKTFDAVLFRFYTFCLVVSSVVFVCILVLN